MEISIYGFTTCTDADCKLLPKTDLGQRIGVFKLCQLEQHLQINCQSANGINNNISKFPLAFSPGY